MPRILRQTMMPRHAGLAGASLVAWMLAMAQPAAAQTVGARPTAAPETATKWVVDLVHSQVDFRVRHLIGRVRGTFSRWYAVLVTIGPNLTGGTVQVSVQTASLNTGNAYRDADLRSNRFFAVDSFPSLAFQGTGIVATDSTVDLRGVLTIKGHSNPVTLSGQYRGIAKDREGHERIAFDASTLVDRRDYGIMWNETVAGNSIVGNEVEITIAIEAVRVD
jgi:polyisoprenoid-binding protein YceI